MKGSCWAITVAATVSGPKASSEKPAAPRQLASNQGRARHMMTLASPKPSMERLTTSEPKCAQLPTAKTRMRPICRAITAPATSATARYRGTAADPATGACRTGAAGFIGYPPRY